MIIDTIDHASRYFHMHKYFKEAFEFIKGFHGDFSEAKKIPLIGNDLIAIIEPVDGRGHAGARLEAHQKYIDIQYCFEGHEEMGWKPHRDCHSVTQTYNPEKDIEFFSDAPTLWVPVPPKSFTVFFPDDAHAPLAGSGKVKKIIMKIAVHPEGSSS